LYYQTTELTDQQIKDAKEMASSQDIKILQLITSGGEWTAWKIKEVFPKFEITSIRRSLHTLEKKEGKIIQNGFVPGPKGKPVGVYLAALTQGKLF